MKTIICAIILLTSLTSTAAFAQTIPLDYLASERTREMSVTLGLNDADYMKLRDANLYLLTQQTEIAEMYKNNVTKQQTELREVQTKYETQLRAFLNAKQLEIYATVKTANNNAGEESAMAIEPEKP